MCARARWIQLIMTSYSASLVTLGKCEKAYTLCIRSDIGYVLKRCVCHPPDSTHHRPRNSPPSMVYTFTGDVKTSLKNKGKVHISAGISRSCFLPHNLVEACFIPADQFSEGTDDRVNQIALRLPD